MQESTISKIAEEILTYRGKCAKIDVNSISKTLMNLDSSLKKYNKNKQLKRDEPKEV